MGGGASVEQERGDLWEKRRAIELGGDLQLYYL